MNTARLKASMASGFLAASLSLACAQTTLTWTGPHRTGLWNDPTNWVPEAAPNGTVDVVVTSDIAYGPQLSTDASVHNLTFAGGPSDSCYIAGDYNLTVNGRLNVAVGGALILGAGLLNTVGGIWLSNTAACFYEGRTVNNSGAVTLDGDGALIRISGLYDAGALFFNNLTNGVVELRGNGTVTGDPVGGFNNAGRLEKTAGNGTGFISDMRSFTNTGTVSVQSGTLQLECAVGASSGAFNVAAGAVCDFTNTGEFYFNPGATLSGSGLYRVDDGASVYLCTDASLSHLAVACGGELINSNTLSIDQSFDLARGNLYGPGTTVLLPGSTLSLDTTGLSQNVQNSGTATLTNSVNLSEMVISNLSDGVFEVDGGANGAGVEAGYSAVFDNAGLLKATADAQSACTIFFILFTNTGTVRVESGTLALSVGSSRGTFEVSAGAACEIGAGDTGLPGAYFDFTPGAALNGAGLYQIDDSATVHVSADLFVNQLRLAGSLVNSNSLTISRSFDFQGELYGPGAVGLPSGSVMMVTNGSGYIEQQTINNAGTVTWDGASLGLSSGARLNNLAGGVVQMTGDGQTSSWDATASFNNQGVFEKVAGVGTNELDGSFTNSGTLSVQRGTVCIGNGRPAYAYTQKSGGTLDIWLGGTAAGSGYGKLRVGGAATLDGTLNITLAGGFRPQDGQEFEVITYKSRNGVFASITGLDLGGGLSLVPGYGPTGLVLTAVQASQPQFSARPAYSNGQFRFQLSGASGQNIVLQASTDLMHWEALQTNAIANSPLEITDTNAFGFPHRFYRALRLP